MFNVEGGWPINVHQCASIEAVISAQGVDQLITEEKCGRVAGGFWTPDP